MERPTVRAYRAEDRAAVRRICFETGYMGASAGWYWRHASSFADIWTGYYTDREPESLWVASIGGRVVGYLTGCVDTRRAPSPADAVKRAMRRDWLFLRPGTAGFFMRAAIDMLRFGGAPEGETHDPLYPAHLHVNLLPEARGSGLGGALMHTWLDHLRSLGVPGCHLGTLHENEHGIGFFLHHGFRREGAPQPTPGLRSPDGHVHHAQLMVCDLTDRL